MYTSLQEQLNNEIITKQMLIEEYVEKEQSLLSICAKYNITIGSIYRKIKQLNINLKGYNHKGINNPMYGKKRPDMVGKNNPIWNSKLIQCKVCQKEFYMCIYHIKHTKNICCSRTCSTKFRKTLIGQNNGNYKDGRSLKDYFCKICGKEASVTSALYGSGLCRSCIQKEMSGENHWNWQEGLSFEPYSLDWTERLRESIRDRDNHECQLCHKTQEQEIKDLNRKLSVHHIDYDKQTCKEENLITLCLRCHGKKDGIRAINVMRSKRRKIENG
jgi:predicted DNA-binding protein YlxM (UPF0122 family)